MPGPDDFAVLDCQGNGGALYLTGSGTTITICSNTTFGGIGNEGNKAGQVSVEVCEQ